LQSFEQLLKLLAGQTGTWVDDGVLPHVILTSLTNAGQYSTGAKVNCEGPI